MAPQFAQSDIWPEEREGYHGGVPVAYAPVPVPESPRRRVPVAWEERFASLIAAAGVVWGVQVLTSPIAHMNKLLGHPGPLEICGISILVWLHAKWRRSVNR